MDLEVNIPFVTDEGNKYVLEFSLSEDANGFVEIPIVEVAISLKKRVANTNSTKVFNFIIEQIRAYLAAIFITVTLLSVVLLLLNILEVCSLVLCSKKLTPIYLLKNKKLMMRYTATTI